MSENLNTLHWRSIGPFRGGRVVAVAGHPTDREVFYFGACAGGVWKTEDGGIYWNNISDGYFATASVGAIAVAESDPNVLYVGTGEACIRGYVSHGDGVYRSTDGGKKWHNIGLNDTRHISRIRINPNNPDIAYVAALGHAFGTNEERGVFRTKDGGHTWEKILYKSEKAGAADLSMDPMNPRILYATIWETLRQPWDFISGGLDSGIFRSTDGGDNWTDITDRTGLPDGIKGRMGVAVSPSKPGRVWAIVESVNGGLFRSDDAGDSWNRLSDDVNLIQRPWYYSHVVAHPSDENIVWVLNLKAWKSTDGGSTFTQMNTPNTDNHDLWIDPEDPSRMIEGNDGGACVSFNGGESWSSVYNQPTAQFYHVAVDDQFPFRAYATQQDNSAISIPSRSIKGAIQWEECERVGNAESGHIAVKHGDPNIVYSGTPPHGGDYLLRYDRRDGQVRIISPWPEFNWGYGVKHHKYRFQWTYPIVASRHDSSRLYVAANLVLQSYNEGSSWTEISPDLTRKDITKMGTPGGPITGDHTGPEHYGTIFAFAESPIHPGILWAGSDDGLVHVSTDGAETWVNVTPLDFPEWTTVSMIEPSSHDPATAYMAATGYKLDDNSPLLYRTSDFGQSWTSITNGIRPEDFTRVIRADLVSTGVLYLGTETGIYVSFNDGDSWQTLQLDLPVVPVHDIGLKHNEIVAATHGRSFWGLDALTSLRQSCKPTDDIHLYTPADTFRIPPLKGSRLSQAGKNYGFGAAPQATYISEDRLDGPPKQHFLNAGANPPDGVVIRYRLPEILNSEVTLELLDSEGSTLRHFSSMAPSSSPPGAPIEPMLSTNPGINVFEWDLRHAGAIGVPGAGAADKALPGPIAIPGTYKVRLTVGETTYSKTFELFQDPNSSASIDDLTKQRDLLILLRDKRTSISSAVHQVRDIRNQVEKWNDLALFTNNIDSVKKTSDNLLTKLNSIEEDLIQVKVDGQMNGISHPAKLDAKIAELTIVVASGDHLPTIQSQDLFNDLSLRLQTVLDRLKEIIGSDLEEYLAALSELQLPVVKP